MMRVLWFVGRPFPVTSHPRGIDDDGTHWHVQTPDGEWHAVVARREGDSEGEGWRAVMVAIGAWLDDWFASHF